VRRIAARLGLWSPGQIREHAPSRPVGAKLELLYACNLRCTFCYTDSPRHTVAGTAALADDEWRRLAEELLELGIVEAVVTGGEPLMRADLALELVERLAAEGVGVTLNSNGWFLDDEIADRIAEVPGVSVHVSIDGPSPRVHDAGRGVPGSWRRAVLAVDRLLQRGIGHQVVSVVTPEVLPLLDEHLALMDRLGVASMRITPVAEIGAAARLRGQHVPRKKLLDAIERHRRSYGGRMRISAQYGNVGLVPVRDRVAPAALLIRPNGSVLTDSQQPFSYGNAVSDGVAECWERIRTGWRDPRISEWASSIPRSGKVRDAEVVPYLSDELDLSAPHRAAKPVNHLDDPLPRRAEPKDDDLDPPELIRSLALARTYRREPAIVGGGERSTYVRRLGDGRIVRVNQTALEILEALDDASCAAAVERLAELYPGVSRERLADDTLATAATLLDRGFLRPAGAAEGHRPLAVAATPDLPDAIPGIDAAE
jgi:MoaA/NifB/PqqE/SkfB family radical SAM enzyme